MLNVYFGTMPEAIYNTAIYFKNTCQDKWIADPLAAEMIADVNRSKVVAPQVLKSPVLGMITPLQLSGGVKTLLLIANDRSNGHIFNASACGDNCAKWLLRLAEKRKVVVNPRHLMDFGDEPFKLRVLNNGRIVRNVRELVEAAGQYVRGTV